MIARARHLKQVVWSLAAIASVGVASACSEAPTAVDEGTLGLSAVAASSAAMVLPAADFTAKITLTTDKNVGDACFIKISFGRLLGNTEYYIFPTTYTNYQPLRFTTTSRGTATISYSYMVSRLQTLALYDKDGNPIQEALLTTFSSTTADRCIYWPAP